MSSNLKDFRGIAGQKDILNSLSAAITGDREGHAYIFAGPGGIGKRTVATAFSSVLLCTSPVYRQTIQGGNEVFRCGSCMACQLFDEGTNPDYIVLETDENSIGVDDIRKLHGDIIIKPMYSRKKVYLIADAGKMTVQAQNGLLKTLEEPPPYGVIILTTTSYESLLETIRSRALKYSFSKNTREEVQAVLLSRLPKEPADIGFIIAYADGVIGKALEIASSEEFCQMREQAVEIVQRISRGRLLDIFDAYDFFESHKSNIGDVLDIMLLLYRDLLIADKGELNGNENILINSDKKDIIVDIKPRFNAHRLVRSIELIEETRRNLKYNVNFQLAIETMLIKLQEE